MKLFSKNAPGIVGVWSQPQHPDWFPDVNIIAFDKNGQTTYNQGGKPVYYVYDDKIFWKENYKQYGSRVTFSDINLDVAAPLLTIIPYYDVLLGDG